MDLKNIFESVPDQEKIEFLFNILEKDEKIRTEFIEKISVTNGRNKANEMMYDDFLKLIHGSYDDYLSEMESLDLEETDWENYVAPHQGYIPEYEAARYVAEQEADNLFGSFKDDLLTMLVQNNIEDIVADLLAFWFAAKEADIDDPSCNLGDPANDYFINMYQEFVSFITEKIAISNLNNNKFQHAIILLLKYFETEREDEYSDIKNFENLLITMLQKITDTSVLTEIKNNAFYDQKYLPNFALQIEKMSGNNTEWLETAEKYYLIDKNVGTDLLEHYKGKDIPQFLRVAKELFKTNNTYWAEKIAPMLELDQDREFYKTIYQALCKYRNRIADYLLVKDILTESEKEILHENISGRLVFRTEIYHEEKQFEKIKEIVSDNLDSWDFNKLIHSILNIYPGFCFSTLEQKSVKALEKERGRHVYQAIVDWMKLAKKIKGFEQQANRLILQLYNHKPNLSALRDEFRVAKLI